MRDRRRVVLCVRVLGRRHRHGLRRVQFSAVKVSAEGLTVTSGLPDANGVTVTGPAGCDASTTV